jgi:hypothetical protein
MMSGQLVVGGAGSSGGTSSLGSPLLWLLVAVAAGTGAIYLARRKPERAPHSGSNQRSKP